MAEKNQNNNPMNSGKSGRPNYQMWIVATVVAVVGAFAFFSQSGTAVDINPHRFEQMLLSNDVERVVLVKNRDIVEVTLKQEALSNAKYAPELENRAPLGAADGPHYRFRIADPRTFDEDFEEATSNELSKQ